MEKIPFLPVSQLLWVKPPVFVLFTFNWIHQIHLKMSIYVPINFNLFVTTLIFHQIFLFAYIDFIHKMSSFKPKT